MNEEEMDGLDVEHSDDLSLPTERSGLTNDQRTIVRGIVQRHVQAFHESKGYLRVSERAILAGIAEIVMEIDPEGAESLVGEINQMGL